MRATRRSLGLGRQGLALATETAWRARGGAAAAALACAVASTPAVAGVVDLSLAYTVDVIGAVSGDSPHRGRVLDNYTLDADADLAQIAQWRGAKAHATVLGDYGGTPNDDVGTLQGVDNIEVASHRLRLFEAWIEQDFGDGASLRVGLYNLNAEFYANDSAGLLLAPAYGIGSELAATGPNGPSIFPSTALAARLRLQPAENTYVQAAVLNARAGVLGDPGGVDLTFDDGVLVIGEVGWAGATKLSLGGWTYTTRQDDIRAVDAAGRPQRRRAAGAYLLLERLLWGEDAGRKATGFVRAGLADGDTTPFRGGWQAGVLVEGLFASRPDSQVSFGVNQAHLAAKFRANAADAGQPASRAESQLEITYADTFAGRLTVQPDLQYVIHPGGDAARRDAVVLGLRLGVEF